MNCSITARALAAALIAVACAGTSSSARADVKDYEFKLVDTSVKTGPATMTVRLVNKLTGKPVANAVIFAIRLDMTPEGMSTMTASVTPMPATEPGTYRFKADVSMAGKWQLSLGAKVQGETGTVEGKLVVPAQK